MSLSRDRLKQLEEVEQDVVVVIESASQSLLELSKQQPSEEYVIARTTEFLKGIKISLIFSLICCLIGLGHFFRQSFIHLLIHSPINSFTHSIIQSFIHSSTHTSFFHSFNTVIIFLYFVELFISVRSCTCSFAHSLTHFFIPSFLHSFIHPFFHFIQIHLFYRP